jgi:hypothetical protein
MADVPPQLVLSGRELSQRAGDDAKVVLPMVASPGRQALRVPSVPVVALRLVVFGALARALCLGFPQLRQLLLTRVCWSWMAPAFDREYWRAQSCSVWSMARSVRFFLAHVG